MARCPCCGQHQKDVHEKLFMMEKRTAAGVLDFSEPQPPFLYGTEQEIFDYYFSKNPGQQSASQEVVAEWYRAQGFTWRLKTW